MDSLIMEFHIIIKPEQINSFKTDDHAVTIIPFEGYVDSDLFTGTIVPGAADIQVTDPAGVRHMCAKYMFTGKDASNQPCHLYVENNGYFMRDQSPSPFEAYPTFISDSKKLNDYLGSNHFRSEGHSAPDGVTIKIFDTQK